MFAKIKAFLLKAGNTAFGKAVEHAAVAAVSVAISMVIADLSTGGLNASTLTQAGIAAGTAFLAGVRAFWKKKAEPAS